MRTRRRWCSGALLLTTLACVGCSLTFQSPIRVRPLNEPRPEPDAAHAPPPGPPPGARPVPPGLSPDQLSLLMQKLAALDDDRKVMAARLQQTEVQLRDKDQSVVQASYEIQESTKQIQKARDELQRNRQEVEELRTRIRQIEKENKATLETVLRVLDAESDPGRASSRMPTFDEPARHLPPRVESPRR